MFNARDDRGQPYLPCCPPEREELQHLAAKVARRYRDRGATPDTLKMTRRVFRILESLDVRTVAELADETIDRRFGEWTASDGLAESTRDLLRGHLHAIIRRAHEWNLLPRQPALPSRVKPGGSQWRLEHPPSRRTLPPSPDVVRLVLEYLLARKGTWTGFRSYAYLATIAWTRLQLRSAIRLRKDNVLLSEGDPLGKGDVDLFPTPVFRFRPRNGKERRLRIPDELVTIFDEWIPKNGSAWWVFPGRTKDVPWSMKSGHSETPASELDAACRALGIEPFTCERLRGALVSPRSEATGTPPPLDISPPTHAPAPLADGSELAAAAPAERNDRIPEAPPAAPEASMPKAPRSDLSVDDLAVAAWTRLSKEKGRPPSVARVAREIGHTRQHLYRCPNFMSLTAREKAERDERKQRFLRGWKEPSGKVEARQDED